MKYWIRPVSLTVEAKQSELADFFENPVFYFILSWNTRKVISRISILLLSEDLTVHFYPYVAALPVISAVLRSSPPPLAHTNQAVMQESMGKVGIKQRLMTSYKDACCKKGFILWIEKKLTKSFYQTRIEGFLIQK